MYIKEIFIRDWSSKRKVEIAKIISEIPSDVLKDLILRVTRRLK